MKIYTHLQLGDFHPTFCEDFLFHTDIDEQYHLAAVMDGCSTAKDSHFASVLFAKLLSKIVRLLPYQPILKSKIDLKNTSVKKLATYILQEFFKALATTKNTLLLDTEELLSTLILLVYHQQEREVFMVALGDGVVVINGEVMEIEQNNRPAYPAFYLGQMDLEQLDFDLLKARVFHQKGVRDVSIATDGVTSFVPVVALPKPPTIDPLTYLLIDDSFLESELMLHKKCLILERDLGLKASDDLGIVRISDEDEIK